jgi:hypothetical protein
MIPLAISPINVVSLDFFRVKSAGVTPLFF